MSRHTTTIIKCDKCGHKLPNDELRFDIVTCMETRLQLHVHFQTTDSDMDEGVTSDLCKACAIL